MLCSSCRWAVMPTLIAPACVSILSACAPKVELQAPTEPVTINLNLKIEHEIRVKVDEELEHLFEDEEVAVLASRESAENTGTAGRSRFSTGLPLMQASPVEQAKQVGNIGEQADGYLGALSDALDSDAALVAQVNAERQRDYAPIAAGNQVPLETVAALAGEKRVARAPSGEWIRAASGQWLQK